MIKGFNFSTCKLIAWVQIGSYEALQTAEAKNGSKHLMWTVTAAIAFTNITTQGLWWDSKRKRGKNEAQQMLLFVTGLYIYVCHEGRQD